MVAELVAMLSWMSMVTSVLVLRVQTSRPELVWRREKV